MLEQPDRIPDLVTPPETLALQIEWDQFTGEGPINQIDSGL